MRAPSFRSVCQYTGNVVASIADQALITIGGALVDRAAQRALVAVDAFGEWGDAVDPAHTAGQVECDGRCARDECVCPATPQPQ